MYVIPQTVVKFYRDIPWNNDYKHTIWFTNVNAQNTFFASKLAYTFNDFTYVRQSGVIRVPHIADDLYNCNYISFLNAGYGNKIFYAFITKVEYVNNETTHVYFELDYIQTWLFDITVEQCFVEREHVADDTIGLHTVDEKLETGEYVIEKETRLLSENLGIMLGVADSQIIDVPTTGNVAICIDVYGWRGYTPQGQKPNFNGFNDILVPYTNTPEKIAFLKMIVSDFIDTEISPGSKNNLTTFENSFSFTRNQNIEFHNTCEGQTYVPKNNKLKCFPYCCFTVDNFNGDVTQYRWEDFTNPFDANFKERGTPLPVPVMECFPVDFKRNYSSPISDVPTKQYVTTFDNFPEVPYSTDTFKIWSTSQFAKNVASLGTTVALATLSTPAMAGTNIALREVAAAHGTKSYMDTQTDYEYHQLHDRSLNGKIGDAGLCWNDNEVGFRFTYYQIKSEYAKMIDNFLTRFGYKVDIYKVPELTSRRYFNYVKTLDASVRGNIPTDCQKLIASIFDSGITLWHTSDVGNYNVDNAIVG